MEAFMREINQPWFNDLLADHQPPCVSIYLPLHRADPPSTEDPIRFRDELERMQAVLAKRYDDTVIRLMVEKVSGVVNGNGFWVGDRDGVAIFASPDFLQLVDLQNDPRQPIEEQVVVADSFHVKPLIRTMQTDDRYHLLCVEIKEVRLFEGSRYRLEPVPLKNVPQNPEEVAGMRLSRAVDAATDMAQAPAMQDQGPGSVTEGVPVEQFFRAVDKAVWEGHSRDAKLPLILCCAEQYQDLFHALSRNQYLLPQGISLNPHRLPLDRLREEAWRIIEPGYLASIDKLTNSFRAAKAHRKGSDELMEVAEAISQGRVGTLLVQENAQVPGILQRGSGMVLPPDPTHPSDDVLDDLAEEVLKMDGRVVVLPPEAMPTETGVAAIYRY